MLQYLDGELTPEDGILVDDSGQQVSVQVVPGASVQVMHDVDAVAVVRFLQRAQQRCLRGLGRRHSPCLFSC